MVKYVVFVEDVKEGNEVLFKKETVYKLVGNKVMSKEGFVVDLENIWVDYAVKVKEEVLH